MYIELLLTKKISLLVDEPGYYNFLSETDLGKQISKLQFLAIKESINEGWSVGRDHTFFLLTNFTKTDFKKTSPGGIFRVRYFNLENELEIVPNDITEIAEQLKTKTWK